MHNTIFEYHHIILILYCIVLYCIILFYFIYLVCKTTFFLHSFKIEDQWIGFLRSVVFALLFFGSL